MIWGKDFRDQTRFDPLNAVSLAGGRGGMPATRRCSPGSQQTALRGILLAVIANSSLAFHLASHYGVRLGQHGRSHFVQHSARGGLPTPRTAAFSRSPSLGALRVQLSAKAEKSDQDLLEDAYEVLNVADIGFTEAGLLLERSQRASAQKGEVLVEEGSRCYCAGEGAACVSDPLWVSPCSAARENSLGFVHPALRAMQRPNPQLADPPSLFGHGSVPAIPFSPALHPLPAPTCC